MNSQLNWVLYSNLGFMIGMYKMNTLELSCSILAFYCISDVYQSWVSNGFGRKRINAQGLIQSFHLWVFLF